MNELNNNIDKLKELKEKMAIVILTHSDYESFEIAMASHAKFTVNKGIKIYILQNGKGTYDCERTLKVGKRYQMLFPGQIEVIDDIEPNFPFLSIKSLLNSERFKKYEHIIKMDDDLIVLTNDWVDKLCNLYISKKEEYKDDLAYVTPLINNNPYGFKKIIELSEKLREKYFNEISRKHFVGTDKNFGYGPYRIIEKNEVCSGANGTIWGTPSLVTWLHVNTSLKPLDYIELSKKWKIVEVPNKERYSIGCVFFEKKFWNLIDSNSNDDEFLFHKYCLKYNKKIFADLSIPTVHVSFFVQKDECKNLMENFYDVYSKFLNLNFPIRYCNNRLIELENRLRFLESKYLNKKNSQNLQVKISNKSLIKKIYFCIKTFGLKKTLKLIFYKLKSK